MKYTLLDMVQRILSAMDSDEVNSISDTTEAYQVALLVQQVYYDIASEMKLPEEERMFQLVNSLDVALPCLMTLPSNCIELYQVQYDTILDTETYANWKPLQFCPLDTFMEMQNNLRGTDNIGEMNVPSTGTAETFKVLYKTNEFPKYYTTFNDSTLLFDGYRSDIDTTLTASKTLCHGRTYNAYLLQDSFTPSLSADQFAYFLNKAKTRAFFEVKQQENPEAAAETRLQRLRLQRDKRVVDGTSALDKIRRYGRK